LWQRITPAIGSRRTGDSFRQRRLLGLSLLLFSRFLGCSLRKLHTFACLLSFLNVYPLLLNLGLIGFEVAPLRLALEWHNSSLLVKCDHNRPAVHCKCADLLDISFASSVTALTCDRSRTFRCLALWATKLVLSHATADRIRAFLCFGHMSLLFRVLQSDAQFWRVVSRSKGIIADLIKEKIGPEVRWACVYPLCRALARASGGRSHQS
jgi:hypothetical protein